MSSLLVEPSEVRSEGRCPAEGRTRRPAGLTPDALAVETPEVPEGHSRGAGLAEYVNATRAGEEGRGRHSDGR